MNRDQTNITFDVYYLFTRRPTRSCFAGILSIWFPCKILRQDSHKIYNNFSTLSLQFVPYFSKFLISFQLVLGWIYSVALEIVREKVFIGQLPGLQYKKEISLTSTGHAGNLPYANKTNKLQKI